MITALFLALAAAPAQQEAPATLRPEQLELASYTPQRVDAQELYSVAEQMFGRDIELEDRDIHNINLIYDSVLVYDTPERCRRIVEMLASLERQLQGAEDSAEDRSAPPLLRDIPLLDLRLRSMDVETAFKALEPHIRDVSARNDAGELVSFRNVQMLADGLLLLRDTRANLDAMRGLIERLDTPTLQVVVSAWVLHGGAEEPDALPPELDRALDALLPGMEFTVASRGLLQSSAAPDRQMQLTMASSFESAYDLKLITGPFDAAEGRLNLRSCEFYARRDAAAPVLLFETSTVLVQGEYAVIGFTGADPVLLVLRMTAKP